MIAFPSLKNTVLLFNHSWLGKIYNYTLAIALSKNEIQPAPSRIETRISYSNFYDDNEK